MCGIVGYIGNKKVAQILADGLKKLEYRGYDSSGLALLTDKKIEILKAEGKLKNLVDVLQKNKTAQEANNLGIGHIRWATHGIPNELNAHPHLSNSARIAINSITCHGQLFTITANVIINRYAICILYCDIISICIITDNAYHYG